jgi:glycosyltransferase involved in cell wall biosynthesis
VGAEVRVRVRVLYVIDSLVPGGAESSLAVLAGLYPARGIELEVAYLHDRPGLHETLAATGARITSLAGPGGRGGWARRAAALVRERRPDLVHTTLFEADIAGRLAGASSRVPVVSSLVSVRYGRAGRKEPGIRTWRLLGAQVVDIATARLARRFHAVSRHVADVMARRLLVPRSRMDVVPRGRDPQALGRRTPKRTARARDMLGASSGDRLLLAVARQEYPKGLDVLLRALPLVRAEVAGVRLIVAGREGNHTAALRALIGELGIGDGVTFLGSRSDVPELLCAADLFVLPTRREGFPGAVLEAMALEVPIVTTAIPAVSEAVVDGEHAVLVPPDDPGALATAVVAALTSPEACRERALAALARFHDHFTIDRAADGMLRFYEAALSSQAS